MALLSSLGYEPYDDRLRRLTLSPMMALTSADAFTGSATSTPSQTISPRPVHRSVHKYSPLTCGLANGSTRGNGSGSAMARVTPGGTVIWWRRTRR
jgi:hypothetical protein